jgi:hypothetical protein
MIRLFCLLCLGCFSLLSYGQLSVAVSASSDTINFGDEIQVSYKINVPNGVDITSLDFSPINNCSNLVYQQSPADLDSIMDIDVVDGGAFKIDNYNLIATKERLNGPIPLEGTIRMRVSSVGVLDLPRPGIGHLSGAEEILLATPRLFVKPIGALEDINPNWHIIEEEISWKDYLKYVYIFLGMVLLGGVAYVISGYLKKNKEEESTVVPEIILPADVIAIRDLKVLKEKELWQKGDTKGYHTELTRIMRQYIEDRYGVQALEMTSNQLRRELNQLDIDSNITRRFDDILQIADKVKFAKGSAGPELNVQFMEEAFNIVDETKAVKIVEDEEK